jgi:hypothetical protein
MKRRTAEDIGAAALRFLAEEPGRLYGFLNATGLSADALRGGAEDSAILLAALAHAGSDETLAKAFCAAEALKPGALQGALAILDPHSFGQG